MHVAAPDFKHAMIGSQNVKSDEQAIRDLIAAWLHASKLHDNKAVLALMAEDVVFLQPAQEPIRGRAAFAKMQEKLANIDIQSHADIQEIKIFGDWAYCWNHLTVTITPQDGKAVTRAGPVLSVLNRRDGNWLIARDANMLTAA